MEIVNVQRENLVEEFKKVRLFKYLSDEALMDLLDRSDFVRAAAGERIIEEHAVDSYLYVVVEHCVAVHVNEDGQDVYVATIGIGQLVGEAAVFSNFRRTASVVAQEEMVLVRITRDEFMRTLQENPAPGLKILFVIIHGLLTKLREVNLELAFERRHQSDQDEVDAIVNSLLGNGDE